MPWRGIAELKFRIHSPPAGESGESPAARFSAFQWVSPAKAKNMGAPIVRKAADDVRPKKRNSEHVSLALCPGPLYSHHAWLRASNDLSRSDDAKDLD